jgi:protease-4
VTYLERRPGFLARLFAGQSEADASAPRDVFTRLGQQPQALIERALHDARALAAGPAIQARCLECPAVAPLPRLRGEAGSPWLLRLLAALGR